MSRIWVHKLDQSPDDPHLVVLKHEPELSDEDVTSPKVIMSLGDFLGDGNFAAWHNGDWMVYRQPRYQLNSNPAFFILHRPSATGILDYAPLRFVAELIGDETGGVGHTSQHCTECLPPFMDEHPTLAKWWHDLSMREGL